MAAGRNPEERALQLETPEVVLHALLAAAAVEAAGARMLEEGPSEWHQLACANNTLSLRAFGPRPIRSPELGQMATFVGAIAEKFEREKCLGPPDLAVTGQSLPFLGSARPLSRVTLSPAGKHPAGLVLCRSLQR